MVIKGQGDMGSRRANVCLACASVRPVSAVSGRATEEQILIWLESSEEESDPAFEK